MIKPTPGPWKKNGTKIVGPRGSFIADVGDTYADAGANARLIAAAPELLEHLKNCRRYFQGEHESGDYTARGWLNALDEVIAKAEGRHE